MSKIQYHNPIFMQLQNLLELLDKEYLNTLSAKEQKELSLIIEKDLNRISTLINKEK